MCFMRIARTLIGAAVLACLALPSVAQDQDTNDDITALKGQLLQLKVNPSRRPRERSAQIIVAIIRRMDVTTIDKATIDEIAGLLDDQERYRARADGDRARQYRRGPPNTRCLRC
jgi:hypothetical protein